MKIQEFNYTKKDGEKTHRKVMILNNHKDYIDALDLDKLSSEEIKYVLEIQQEYETKLEPYVKKAFRKFTKEGMTDILVEKQEN